MALIDNHLSGPARADADAPAPSARPSLPLAALERLSRLHAENAQTTRQMAFLKAAVNAAGALILLAIAALVFAADASLPACFAWSLLVLASVGALLDSYIRSTAAFERVPAAKAARKLRRILLFAGLAWGAGAFLILPSGATPITVVLFAVLPSLSLCLLLSDLEGMAAFMVPATALSIAAPVAGSWPDAGLETALLLVLQSGIAAYCLLRSRGRDIGVPAGLPLPR